MRSLGLVVLCSLLALGCETRPPTASFDVGPRPDAFRDDAGRDAPGAIDANDDANADANADAGFSPSSCQFVMGGDLFELGSDARVRTTTVALAAGPTSFGVAFDEVDASGFENVFFTEIASMPGTGLSAVAQVTHDTATSGSPSVARSATGWILVWTSDASSALAEVYSLGSDAEGLLSTPNRLTNDTMTQATPLVASSATTSLVIWSELDATGLIPTTVAQPLMADGTLTGATTRIDPTGFTVRPLAFTTTDFGYVLGWSDPDGDALVLSLDATGASSGAPAPLTTLHDSDGTIDAVVSNGGGVAVFGTDSTMPRLEVHAHMLDAAGGATDVERVLTTGTDSGSDASIAELGGGYVVSYRQSGSPPVLRVLFLSSLLTEVGRMDLVPVAASGGRTSIRVSGDGSALVTWADIVGSETHFRAARIRCN